MLLVQVLHDHLVKKEGQLSASEAAEQSLEQQTEDLCEPGHLVARHRAQLPNSGLPAAGDRRHKERVCKVCVCRAVSGRSLSNRLRGADLRHRVRHSAAHAELLSLQNQVLPERAHTAFRAKP